MIEAVPSATISAKYDITKFLKFIKFQTLAVKWHFWITGAWPILKNLVILVFYKTSASPKKSPKSLTSRLARASIIEELQVKVHLLGTNAMEIETAISLFFFGCWKKQGPKKNQAII